LHILLKYQFQ